MFIAFRLKPGRDDDLIAWVSSLGVDERSAGIRHALRGNVSGPVAPTVKIQPKRVTEQTGPCVDLESNLDSWF